jgi:hypothetical protein
MMGGGRHAMQIKIVEPLTEFRDLLRELTALDSHRWRWMVE